MELLHLHCSMTFQYLFALITYLYMLIESLANSNGNLVDSLINISNLQIEAPLPEQKLDSLINMTNVLIDRLPQKDNLWDSISTILSPIASAVTILGIATLWISLRKRYINREWRKLMALDLIRHFFMANSILEAIRVKLNEDLRPQEGIIARIATLDEDVNLNRFSTSKKHYEVIHRLSERIRNFNSVALIADKKCSDKHYQNEEIRFDIDDLTRRSISITEDLINLCNILRWKYGLYDYNQKRKRYSPKRFIDKLGLSEFLCNLKPVLSYEDIRQYIIKSYSNSKVEEWKNNGQYDSETTIMNRDECFKRNYYDLNILNLTDTYNHLIRHNMKRLRFMRYKQY